MSTYVCSVADELVSDSRYDWQGDNSYLSTFTEVTPLLNLNQDVQGNTKRKTLGTFRLAYSNPHTTLIVVDPKGVSVYKDMHCRFGGQLKQSVPLKEATLISESPDAQVYLSPKEERLAVVTPENIIVYDLTDMYVLFRSERAVQFNKMVWMDERRIIVWKFEGEGYWIDVSSKVERASQANFYPLKSPSPIAAAIPIKCHLLLTHHNLYSLYSSQLDKLIVSNHDWSQSQEQGVYAWELSCCSELLPIDINGWKFRRGSLQSANPTDKQLIIPQRYTKFSKDDYYYGIGTCYIEGQYNRYFFKIKGDFTDPSSISVVLQDIITDFSSNQANYIDPDTQEKVPMYFEVALTSTQALVKIGGNPTIHSLCLTGNDKATPTTLDKLEQFPMTNEIQLKPQVRNNPTLAFCAMRTQLTWEQKPLPFVTDQTMLHICSKYGSKYIEIFDSSAKKYLEFPPALLIRRKDCIERRLLIEISLGERLPLDTKFDELVPIIKLYQQIQPKIAIRKVEKPLVAAPSTEVSNHSTQPLKAQSKTQATLPQGTSPNPGNSKRFRYQQLAVLKTNKETTPVVQSTPVNTQEIKKEEEKTEVKIEQKPSKDVKLQQQQCETLPSIIDPSQQIDRSKMANSNAQSSVVINASVTNSNDPPRNEAGKLTNQLVNTKMTNKIIDKPILINNLTNKSAEVSKESANQPQKITINNNKQQSNNVAEGKPIQKPKSYPSLPLVAQPIMPVIAQPNIPPPTTIPSNSFLLAATTANPLNLSAATTAGQNLFGSLTPMNNPFALPNSGLGGSMFPQSGTGSSIFPPVNTGQSNIFGQSQKGTAQQTNNNLTKKQSSFDLKQANSSIPFKSMFPQIPLNSVGKSVNKQSKDILIDNKTDKPSKDMIIKDNQTNKQQPKYQKLLSLVKQNSLLGSSSKGPQTQTLPNNSKSNQVANQKDKISSIQKPQPTKPITIIYVPPPTIQEKLAKVLNSFESKLNEIQIMVEKEQNIEQQKTLQHSKSQLYSSFEFKTQIIDGMYSNSINNSVWQSNNPTYCPTPQAMIGQFTHVQSLLTLIGCRIQEERTRNRQSRHCSHFTFSLESEGSQSNCHNDKVCYHAQHQQVKRGHLGKRVQDLTNKAENVLLKAQNTAKQLITNRNNAEKRRAVLRQQEQQKRQQAQNSKISQSNKQQSQKKGRRFKVEFNDLADEEIVEVSKITNNNNNTNKSQINEYPNDWMNMVNRYGVKYGLQILKQDAQWHVNLMVDSNGRRGMSELRDGQLNAKIKDSHQRSQPKQSLVARIKEISQLNNECYWHYQEPTKSKTIPNKSSQQSNNQAITSSKIISQPMVNFHAPQRFDSNSEIGGKSQKIDNMQSKKSLKVESKPMNSHNAQDWIKPNKPLIAIPPSPPTTGSLGSASLTNKAPFISNGNIITPNDAKPTLIPNFKQQLFPMMPMTQAESEEASGEEEVKGSAVKQVKIDSPSSKVDSKPNSTNIAVTPKQMPPKPIQDLSNSKTLPGNRLLESIHPKDIPQFNPAEIQIKRTFSLVTDQNNKAEPIRQDITSKPNNRQQVPPIATTNNQTLINEEKLEIKSPNIKLEDNKSQNSKSQKTIQNNTLTPIQNNMSTTVNTSSIAPVATSSIAPVATSSIAPVATSTIAPVPTPPPLSTASTPLIPPNSNTIPKPPLTQPLSKVTNIFDIATPISNPFGISNQTTNNIFDKNIVPNAFGDKSVVNSNSNNSKELDKKNQEGNQKQNGMSLKGLEGSLGEKQGNKNTIKQNAPISITSPTTNTIPTIVPTPTTSTSIPPMASTIAPNNNNPTPSAPVQSPSNPFTVGLLQQRRNEQSSNTNKLVNNSNNGNNLQTNNGNNSTNSSNISNIQLDDATRAAFIAQRKEKRQGQAAAGFRTNATANNNLNSLANVTNPIVNTLSQSSLPNSFSTPQSQTQNPFTKASSDNNNTNNSFVTNYDQSIGQNMQQRRQLQHTQQQQKGFDPNSARGMGFGGFNSNNNSGGGNNNSNSNSSNITNINSNNIQQSQQRLQPQTNMQPTSFSHPQIQQQQQSNQNIAFQQTTFSTQNMSYPVQSWANNTNPDSYMGLQMGMNGIQQQQQQQLQQQQQQQQLQSGNLWGQPMMMGQGGGMGNQNNMMCNQNNYSMMNPNMNMGNPNPMIQPQMQPQMNSMQFNPIAAPNMYSGAIPSVSSNSSGNNLMAIRTKKDQLD